MKFNKFFFQYLFVISIFFLFIAKMTAYANPLFEEDNVRKRVKLYWDKRINADYDGMYELEAEVNKKRYKLPEYRKIFGDQASIVGYTVDKINIVSVKREATISISYQIELQIPVPGLLGHKKKLTTEDIWLFENDNWFHIK